MNRLLRSGIVAIVSLALLGCTSLQVIAEGQADAAAKLRSVTPPLKAQDKARILTRDGKLIDLRVTAVSGEAVTGMVDGSSEPVVVAADQIERIERDRVDSGKVLQIVLVIFVAGLAAAYSAAKAIGKGLPFGPQ